MGKCRQYSRIVITWIVNKWRIDGCCEMYGASRDIDELATDKNNVMRRIKGGKM